MCLGTVREHIERIYRRAGSKKLWFVYRCHYVPFGLHLFFFFPNVFTESKAGSLHA